MINLHRIGNPGLAGLGNAALGNAGLEKASLGESLVRATKPQVLEPAIHSLAPEYREVLLLRECCGLNYSQISKIVNEPVGIVMSRLSRARTRLYERLLSSREQDLRPPCPAK